MRDSFSMPPAECLMLGLPAAGLRRAATGQSVDDRAAPKVSGTARRFSSRMRIIVVSRQEAQ